MAASDAAGIEQDARGELRDEVYHRTTATLDDGTAMSLLIVNISPSGLMARTIDQAAPGAMLTLTLPVVGRIRAEVRWALGGRLGCRLKRSIGATRYYEMLAALGR